MSDVSLGQKISWFLYRKGWSGICKPDYLNMATFAEPEWFQIAETLIKDNNLDGRSLVLDYLLEPKNFKGHPKRQQILRMIGHFLSKGILDERRRVAKFIEENTSLFSTKDDVIYGPLMNAMRDSDTQISLAAEAAIEKLRGETSGQV